MEALTIKTAFKYPFNRAKGMWNIFWVLVPIYGWFALGGYGVRLVQEFSQGKFKELPKMHSSSDFKLGFLMLVKAIPLAVFWGVINYLLLDAFSTSNGEPHWVGLLIMNLLSFFIFPILTINFMVKETVESAFEFRIVSAVFQNLGDYILMILKSIVLAIVFLVLAIILVGIPASAFTQNMFITDFYRRRVK